jgi:hypothetical protein
LFRRRLIEQNQPLRLPIRKRAQQNAVDEAEDGAVYADSQGYGQNGYCGKAGSLQHRSQAKAKILQQRFHNFSF